MFINRISACLTCSAERSLLAAVQWETENRNFMKKLTECEIPWESLSGDHEVQSCLIKVIRNLEKVKDQRIKPWICFTCSANSYKRNYLSHHYWKGYFQLLLTQNFFFFLIKDVNGTALCLLFWGQKGFAN